MATDLAEFLGGRDRPVAAVSHAALAGMVVTAVITYVILMLQDRGFRPAELIIGSFVAIIALCYWSRSSSPCRLGAALLGTVKPEIIDAGALLLSSASSVRP